MLDSEFPVRTNRNHPVHQPVIESGNRAVIVFATICTKNRVPILATSAVHDAILQAWRTADHWQVGRYVILPDHIHLFCAPAAYPARSLVNWVRFWKATVAKATRAGPDALWGKDFWDTQLRQSDSYAAKWEYVRNNPVRHGLVTRPEDWFYQGELHLLRWHD